MSYFSGPAWTFDKHTGQYYLHNFDTKQPELNWRNPAVETAIFNAIRFWLRRGVDGFRIDVIDRLIKDPQFRDNPPDPNWKPGDPEIFKYQRVYSEMRSPELFAILERMRGVFDEFDDRVMIGEVIYDATVEQLAHYYGTPQEDGGTNGIHLPFNFQLIQMPWKADSIREFVDQYDQGLPDYAWPNYVRNNHDRERFASLHGQAQARVLAIMLLTLRGTPTLYYGDEIGMVNVPVPADQVKDPAAKGGNFNRDECRSPMQWDSSPNAGFSGAEVKTWLPVAPDYAQRNVANQLADPDSLLSLYRRLLAYRRDTDVLTTGSYQSIDAPEGCFVYLRVHEGQRLLTALNLTAEAKTAVLPNLGSGQVVIGTLRSREGQKVDLAELRLGPDEGVIIALS
jgi:alpha-glucosidase